MNRPIDPARLPAAARIDSGRPGALTDRLAQAVTLACILGGLGGLLLLCCWGVLGRV